MTSQIWRSRQDRGRAIHAARAFAVLRPTAAALAFLTCAGTDSAAEDAPSSYTVLGGAGLATCSEWVAERERNRNGIIVEQINSWLAGFVTAYNRYEFNGKNVLRQHDPDEVLDWAHRFCTANPQLTVAATAEVLIEELNKEEP